MMAFNEGNPAPPPAHVTRLPMLPSNAEIVRPRNADVSLLILRAVLSRGPTALAVTPTAKSQLSCWRTRLLLPALSLAGSRNGPLRKSREI